MIAHKLLRRTIMSEKKTGEKSLRPESALRRMAKRNLRIALAVRPRLLLIKKELGYKAEMSKPEYDTWKESKAEEITNSVLKEIEELSLSLDQVLFINWLFEVTDEEFAKLKDYCNNPKGNPPRSYNLFYSPAFENLSPGGLGWAEETGYRVAITTWEKNMYFKMWGDVRDVPQEAVCSFLQKSGDFVIKGNMDTFDTESWRRIGNMLSSFKRKKGLGKKLGLIPGGKKGRPKGEKHILDDLTWTDIQIVVTQDPKQYNRLCNAYANSKRKEYEEEYKKKHNDQPPSIVLQKEVRKSAIQNFNKHVKKKVIPK